MWTVELLLKVYILESRVSRISSALLSICNFMSVLSGMTKGLTARLWGAIGVSTIFLEVGEMIGPPQLKEYPVEPIGVETIRPSLQ